MPDTKLYDILEIPKDATETEIKRVSSFLAWTYDWSVDWLIRCDDWSIDWLIDWRMYRICIICCLVWAFRRLARQYHPDKNPGQQNDDMVQYWVYFDEFQDFLFFFRLNWFFCFVPV